MRGRGVGQGGGGGDEMELWESRNEEKERRVCVRKRSGIIWHGVGHRGPRRSCEYVIRRWLGCHGVMAKG